MLMRLSDCSAYFERYGFTRSRGVTIYCPGSRVSHVTSHVNGDLRNRPPSLVPPTAVSESARTMTLLVSSGRPSSTHPI